MIRKIALTVAAGISALGIFVAPASASAWVPPTHPAPVYKTDVEIPRQTKVRTCDNGQVSVYSWSHRTRSWQLVWVKLGR